MPDRLRLTRRAPLRLPARVSPQLLTEELVLAKARAHSLEQVKNLNLWGCWLSDVRSLAPIPRPRPGRTLPAAGMAPVLTV